MKTVIRSLVAKPYVAKPYVVALIAAAPLIAVAQSVDAQTAVAPSSVASSNASPSTKAAPAKNYNRALDAELRAAVQSNDISKVRSLLSRNADPNVRDTDNATPALSNAAFFGYLDIVRALVEAGADVEAKTAQGSSALTYATLDGRVEVVKYLLSRGADIESKTQDGITPLMNAASAGETETVRALMDAGANVNARSFVNGTPLMYGSGKSAAGTGNLQIIKMLVEAGADVSVVSGGGKRANEIAADNKLYDINKYLVGIYNRDAALYNVVAKAGREEIAKTATLSTRLANWQGVKDELAKGANPRFSTNSDGPTTLILLFTPFNDLIATLDDNDATMKTIIARSDLDAKEKEYGYTALHLAVDYDNAKMTGWLIKAGANLNLVDAKNRTALDLAVTKNRQNIIPLLKNAGAKTYAQLQNPSVATSTSSTRTPTATPSAATSASQKAANDKALFEAIEKIEEKYSEDEDVTEADWDVVRKLLDGGATGLYADSTTNTTALMIIAASSQDIDDAIAQKILARSDVNAQNYAKSTALHKAAGIGNVKMVGWLIKAGANLNLLNKENETPLDLMLKETLVVKPNRQSIIALLKNAGAKTYAELQKSGSSTSSTRTPTPTPKSPPTATMQPQTTSPQPYKSVASDFSLYIALMTIQYKASVGEKVPDSLWSNARTALADGATARYADKDGETALMIIAKALPGAPDEVERQILERADVNAQNKLGLTALHIAAQSGNAPLADSLIRAGAKVNLLNKSNQTALDLAIQSKNDGTAEVLRKGGAKRAADLASAPASSTRSSPAPITSKPTP